jgi:hypothetical protein
LNIIASYKDTDGMVFGRSRPPNDHRPSPGSRLASVTGRSFPLD